MTNGTRSYTIGPGGTFNTTRPISITSAFIRDTGNIDYPVDLINEASYDNIRLKGSGNTYPSMLFYDQAFVAGLATIRLYPVPSSGLTLHISSLRQLTQFATIGEAVVLPPGYQRAIESNFAIEAAAGYIQVSAELAKIAKESKIAIKNVNAPTHHLQLEMMRGARSNIISGGI